MANTERIKVIRIIRTAKRSARKLRLDTSIKKRVRNIIEDIFLELDRLEEELIFRELSKPINDLKDSADRLGELNKQIKEMAEELAAFVEKVEAAAKVVKVLADVAVKLAAI